MMSEKEKEKVKEMKREEVILDHFFHPHPLSLSVVGNKWGGCYGCPRTMYPEETAYACSRDECGSNIILHEECAEMPREITLSMHPQHTLIQKRVIHWQNTCAVCQKEINYIGYHCTSSDPQCGFRVHVGCAQNIDVLKKCIDHPSHPHQLTLLWRPGRSCSFRCDACGITHKGNSYMCLDCQYWIHESCAALHALATFQHHQHPLSLIYCLPLEYAKFEFKCQICLKDMLPKYWAYHCGICRYVVHINCAINTVSGIINANADEDDGLIGFPTNNVEEMIASFAAKQVTANNPNVIEYKFPIHDHQLHLIPSPLHYQDDDDKEEEDDVEELDHGKKSELVCDGCTMPINTEKKYMSCGECKYFLHLPCSQLPPHLPSHPLHPQPNHDLILHTTPNLATSRLSFTYCSICRFDTNGLFYKCNKCTFQADIKCATLPNTIKHEAHPYHHLKLLNESATCNGYYWQRCCTACGDSIYAKNAYICERNCQIFLHSSCATLPASVTNPTWDKHALPLTFDATVNRPGDFYCDVCEQQMHPKRWMYHCQECDVSIHPRCVPTALGQYRNIKFGRRYLFAGVHHHPLAHQLLPSTKPRCHVCGIRNERGFLCDSHKCNFFMCSFPCSANLQKTVVD